MTTNPNSGIDHEPTEPTVTADPDDQSIVITHAFNVMPEHLFEAYTDPDLIPEWWGPRGYETIVDEMLETGGEDGAIEAVERLAELVESGAEASQ